MICGFNLITGLNLFLSVIILCVGCWGYIRTKDKEPFHFGVAFGLFGISHLIALMGLEREFELTVILIRIFGYLIVLGAVYKMTTGK